MRKKKIAVAAILVLMLVSLPFMRLKGSVRVKTLSSVDCNMVFYFQQRDPAWSEQKLGNSSYTMNSSGCLTTCIASILKMESVTLEGISDITPGTLNPFFGEKQVYDTEGNIVWGALEQALHVTVMRANASDVKSDGLDELLKKNIYPIVRVRVNGLGNFHYVVIVGSDGVNFLCMDPLRKEDELVPLSDFGNRIYAVRYIVLP